MSSPANRRIIMRSFTLVLIISIWIFVLSISNQECAAKIRKGKKNTSECLAKKADENANKKNLLTDTSNVDNEVEKDDGNINSPGTADKKAESKKKDKNVHKSEAEEKKKEKKADELPPEENASPPKEENDNFVGVVEIDFKEEEEKSNDDDMQKMEVDEDDLLMANRKNNHMDEDLEKKTNEECRKDEKKKKKQEGEEDEEEKKEEAEEEEKKEKAEEEEKKEKAEEEEKKEEAEEEEKKEEAEEEKKEDVEEEKEDVEEEKKEEEEEIKNKEEEENNEEVETSKKEKKKHSRVEDDSKKDTLQNVHNYLKEVLNAEDKQLSSNDKKNKKIVGISPPSLFIPAEGSSNTSTEKLFHPLMHMDEFEISSDIQDYERNNEGECTEKNPCRFMLVADLDSNASDKMCVKQLTFRSFVKFCSLKKNKKGKYAVDFDKKEIKVNSLFNEGGRGAELSELVLFKKKLLGFDDRTGIMYQLVDADSEMNIGQIPPVNSTLPLDAPLPPSTIHHPDSPLFSSPESDSSSSSSPPSPPPTSSPSDADSSVSVSSPASSKSPSLQFSSNSSSSSSSPSSSFPCKAFSSSSPCILLFPLAILADIINDGEKLKVKGTKIEWAAVKDHVLYMGSHGTEFLDDAGNRVDPSLKWIRTMDMGGLIKKYDWSQNYKKLADALGCEYPGYVKYEAVLWSDKLRKWVFLPRRFSHAAYTPAADEENGASMFLLADEDFDNISVTTVKSRKTNKKRGFSSARFVPGTEDQVIMALKTEEIHASHKQRTFVTLFTLEGDVLLEDLEASSFVKYEGLEFI